MGNKYTIIAGKGNDVCYYYGTEWLVIALWKLWAINIDKKDIFWKELKIV